MKTSFWKGKKIAVTGGGGFIGSHLVERLVSYGSIVTVVASKSKRNQSHLSNVVSKIRWIEGDCRNLEDMKKACHRQDIVMNLAARVGGIEYNQMHQATMLRDNLLIDTNVLEAARLEKVQRFLVVSSACIYPRDCLVPTPESDGFVGEPESTNGGYGWAKRMAEKLGMYYHEEFGMEIAIARPYNCYGTRDHFEPEVAHVIPSLIRRIFSGENPLVVWGSGKQTRAFLYVDDFVEGLLLTTEKYPVADPVNIGTDEEVTIGELVKMIIKLSGKHPKVVFDTTKPDGSPRRNSDNAKAVEKIGFNAQTLLHDGLRKTIEWYNIMNAGRKMK